MTIRISIVVFIACMFISACGSLVEENVAPVAAIPTATFQPTPEPTSVIPNLQAELTDERSRMTNSPIGKFD